jgi:hypothetical protein
MKRFHIHISVDDLAKNIRIYSTLFGTQPSTMSCLRRRGLTVARGDVVSAAYDPTRPRRRPFSRAVAS